MALYPDFPPSFHMPSFRRVRVVIAYVSFAATIAVTTITVAADRIVSNVAGFPDYAALFRPSPPKAPVAEDLAKVALLEPTVPDSPAFGALMVRSRGQAPRAARLPLFFGAPA